MPDDIKPTTKSDYVAFGDLLTLMSSEDPAHAFVARQINSNPKHATNTVRVTWDTTKLIGDPPRFKCVKIEAVATKRLTDRI